MCGPAEQHFECKMCIADGLMCVAWDPDIVQWLGDDALGELGFEVVDDVRVPCTRAADEELVDFLPGWEVEVEEMLVLLQYILCGYSCDGRDCVFFVHVMEQTLVDELLGFVVTKHLSGHIQWRQLAEVVV